MIDKESIPQLLNDTAVEVNPYEITDKIWNLIEPYFEKKYKVEFTEVFPTKDVTRPTIVATSVKRTPGISGSKVHGKGANFAKFLKVSTDGYVHERHVQQHELILEYTIYATSTAELKSLAWDVERAVLETTGIIQAEIEGYQLVFEQQMMDSSLHFRGQDDLLKKALRFRVLLPIQYTKLLPELRFVELVQTWGRLAVEKELLTRSSSEKIYYIPVDANQKVVNVNYIYVEENGTWVPLVYGTDWKLKKDSSSLYYIEWNDDYGKVPSIGGEFRVDYEIAQLTTGSTLTKN